MINTNAFRLTLAGICLLTSLSVDAQTKIGTTSGPGNASAILELESSSQGLLLPRLTSTQRDAISSPATGLTIYNTTINCLQIYKGASNGGWHDYCSSSGGSGGSVSFTNCGTPVITGSFTIGVATTATVTLNYSNSSGQTYGTFNSATVNGITFSAPGGAITPLTAGTGSIVLTASGTPTATGATNIPVVLAGAACAVPLTVSPPTCSDPGATAGSTGCVTFTYQGQTVTYTTVRAKDGKIWLQQNLGSSRVATSVSDANAFGHYFQWGRWDDGHQLPTSTANPTALSPNNPSAISSGRNEFLKDWWIGGANTNTWSSGAPSATNGTDPCAALGTGWRMPTAAEWNTMKGSGAENITSVATAFSSNLKIAGSGWRDCRSGYPHLYGQMFSTDGSRADFWTSTLATGSNAYEQNISVGSAPDPTTTPTERGQAHTIRCIKP